MRTMYDNVNLGLIPATAEVVAGYVNGRWPTFTEVERRWPHAIHVSIAVTRHADADCLDVEPGDASNADAPAWVKRQQARGLRRPILYTSVSNAAALLRTLAAAGIKREHVRLWTAHYTGREHLCGPRCGFGMPTTADATQWTDRALGRSLDRSLCAESFFAPVHVPDGGPKPTPAWWWRWADWRRRGRKGKRPAGAPKRIPRWAWRRLVEFNRKHPIRKG